jgi:hypothetical protein
MAKTFTFFQDPGHGWIRVTPADCAAIGLTAESFTAYSYRDEKFFYLEEDCDASRFVAAYESKHGTRPAFRESVCRFRESSIRRKARINSNY